MSDDILAYEEDIRKDLTPGRRANFKQGWTRAAEGKEYDCEATLDVLTWNNLGWRLGKIFDETPDDMREELLEWCNEQRNLSDSR